MGRGEGLLQEYAFKNYFISSHCHNEKDMELGGGDFFFLAKCIPIPNDIRASSKFSVDAFWFI